MPWNPRYTITDKLLQTSRLIGEAIGLLEFITPNSKTVAMLEAEAKALSTFASSRIERNPLTLEKIKQLLNSPPQHIDKTEREVLNYKWALEWLYEAVKTRRFILSSDTIQKVQAMVVDGLGEKRSTYGAYRQQGVVVHDPRQPDTVVFEPPDYQAVPGLIGELVAFINIAHGNIDPIILAGLFHRQFVIIHPFMEGNGHAARLLTTALLGQIKGFELLSLENYYNQDARQYFQKVGLRGDYHDLEPNIDFTEWLEYFATGILNELRRVQKIIPQSAPLSLKPHELEILAYIKKHGTITLKECETLSEYTRSACSKHLQKLAKEGLIERQGKARSTYYVLSVKGEDYLN